MANADPPLRLDVQTVVDLPRIVLEDAYWYPQSAGLKDQYKRLLIAKADQKKKRIIEEAREAWAREETWANDSLIALLTALPESVVTALLAGLLPGVEVSEAQVVKLDTDATAEVTGVPDFILRDAETCVLGESKIAVHKGNHRYTFDQFSKYMSLGALFATSRDAEIRRRAVHVLLVPSADPKEFCKDYPQWQPSVVKGKLVVEPANLWPRRWRSGVVDFASWREFIRSRLLGRAARVHFDVDEDRVSGLLGLDTPVLVPTYVVTWHSLIARLTSLCKAQGLRNLTMAALALGRMAHPSANWSES